MDDDVDSVEEVMRIAAVVVVGPVLLGSHRLAETTATDDATAASISDKLFVDADD